jgi:hypothetical protein
MDHVNLPVSAARDRLGRGRFVNGIGVRTRAAFGPMHRGSLSCRQRGVGAGPGGAAWPCGAAGPPGDVQAASKAAVASSAATAAVGCLTVFLGLIRVIGLPDE